MSEPVKAELMGRALPPGATVLVSSGMGQGGSLYLPEFLWPRGAS